MTLLSKQYIELPQLEDELPRFISHEGDEYVIVDINRAVRRETFGVIGLTIADENFSVFDSISDEACDFSLGHGIQYVAAVLHKTIDYVSFAKK